MTQEQAEFYGELFKKLELTELKVEEGGNSLLLKKEPINVIQVPNGTANVQQGIGNIYDKASEESINQSASFETVKDYEEINAPLLGIFHRAPAPNEQPFVEAGDLVKKGDVLCVIEAMKMMNEITASKDGTISEICAKENDIVEYGQTIFKIK